MHCIIIFKLCQVVDNTNQGVYNYVMNYLYGLTDPRNSKIRYIGITKHPLTRFSEHLHTKTNYKKDGWINDLKRVGLRPGIVILDRGTRRCMSQVEKSLIGSDNTLLNIKHSKKEILLASTPRRFCASITGGGYQCLREVEDHENYCYQHQNQKNT